jgi:prepilin-type N-terminal cleavage/methylation domain-containing protein
MRTTTHFCTQSLLSQAGHTLLEVLIALLIMGIVTTAIFQTYVVQHNNYTTQEEITNVQQNARAAIQELGKHARMAGFALPLGVAPIRPANANPDSLTVTYKVGTCDASLSVTMASAGANLQMGSSISCFRTGQYVYIVHPDSGGGEWFQINSIDTVARIIDPAVALSKAYALGTVVVPLQQVTFYIDKSDPTVSRLMVRQPGGAPQVYAESISDFQVTYRMKNGMVLDAPINVEDIREIHLSLIGQSEDSRFDTDANRKNTREFTTSVFLRNVGN